MPVNSPARSHAKSATAAKSAVGKSRPPKSTPEARAQLTPDDWIEAATELLIVKSIDAVRVDVLAKILNVTRGSFYWHFTDRDDLLKRVLISWQEAQTEQIIARYKKQGVAAEDLIRELVELPFHGRAAMKGSSVELAVRAWARRDEEARMIVDQVDAKRLAYITECFSSLDFNAAEAKARAFVLYCYMQSESLFRNQGSAGDKSERRKFISKMLLLPGKD
ncbi:TetR/AcrR family transcriptional regulator [Hydrogenophaga sp. ANAO-22]|jgi:AcrR family transcriptional regulator|uniref:TetR/AcrR family transcriptional regulator n=1 Tax=Hydrogenophaga sp. ANAO-22 TaxID=3166645 RepID=UPI0036D226E9